MSRLITVAQAAEEFFVPERTIRTWLARGLVHWVAPGYLDDQDVMQAEHSTRRTRRMTDLLARAGTVESSFAAETSTASGHQLPGSE